MTTRSWRNRLAARILDGLIALVPEGGPPTPDDGAPKPSVRRYVIRGPDGSPYLTRVVLPRIPVFDVRPLLHKFHRPDADRELHNHPWRWAFSIVLAGAYVEERLGTYGTSWRTVRWANKLTADDYHRIVQLRGEVFTLFLTGQRMQDWGFLTEDRGHVSHRDFFARREERG